MKHSRRPLVSVMMPVLNHVRYVDEAVDSIERQTFADWELLVSDAGSRDGTAAALRRRAAANAAIRLFSHPGSTIAEARNALLAEAAGEFVAVLDSDDVALPERLERQIAFLEGNPGLVGTGSDIIFIGADGGPAEPGKFPLRLTDPDELRRRRRAGWGCFIHSTMLFRRRALEGIGGYRTQFRHAEDEDLYLRLLDRHDLANLPDKLALYRWHGGNASQPTFSHHVYRVVAVAAAHLRLAGLPEIDPARREAFDYPFLLELFDRLGDRSLTPRLFWIGLLQAYGTGMPDMAAEAWRGVLALRRDADLDGEVARHWRTCRTKFPELAAEMIGEADGREEGSVGKWLARAYG